MAQPIGQRITALTYHGQPVTAAQSYDVAVNQYRAGGGGDFRMFDHSKIIRENQKDMTELIADYLRAHPLLPGTANHNFTLLPKM